MVLVFIILGILIIQLSILIMLLLSTIKIEIKNLQISKNGKIKENKEGGQYRIKIRVLFLEKIPILFFNIDNEKISKIRNSKSLKKIDLRKIQSKMKVKKISSLKLLKAIKIIKINITKMYFKMQIGTENAYITAYIVAILSEIIAILLPYFSQPQKSNIKYLVNPLYNNTNEYYLNLNGIFCIKIVHIINTIIFLLKRGDKKKNERSSNRRTYAYSNE